MSSVNKPCFEDVGKTDEIDVRIDNFEKVDDCDAELGKARSCVLEMSVSTVESSCAEVEDGGTEASAEAKAGRAEGFAEANPSRSEAWALYENLNFWEL